MQQYTPWIKFLSLMLFSLAIQGIVAKQLVPLPTDRDRIEYLALSSNITLPDNAIVNDKVEPLREDVPVVMDVVGIGRDIGTNKTSILKRKLAEPADPKPETNSSTVATAGVAVIAKESPKPSASMEERGGVTGLPVTSLPAAKGLDLDALANGLNVTTNITNTTKAGNSGYMRGTSFTSSKIGILFGFLLPIVSAIYIANKEFIN